jgi:glycosyltransferase involved in cell wall biosynthesis
MACGKPVISTLSGSIPEVLGDAGIIVPPADFVALSDSMEMLVRSDEYRSGLGMRARSRAERLFDAHKNAMHLRQHYLELLNA